MRFTGSLCIFSVLVAIAHAHLLMSRISINGVEGNCIRPHRSSEPEAPLATKDNPNGWFSENQACGWLPEGDAAAPAKCYIDAGTNINVRWRHSFVHPESDIVDPSHAGPCIAYLAKSDSSRGKVWFKIWEDGYDASTGKFCVDKLRENQGTMTVPIPSDLASGNYLLRVEIIALHEGYANGGAQPYVHCAELTIRSIQGGSSVGPAASALVSFPGAYSLSDPGIRFDVYQSPKFTSYKVPGPAVYKAGSSGGSVATTGTAQTTTGTAQTTANSAGGSTTGTVQTTGTAQTTNNNGGGNTASTGSATCNIGSERCACTAGGSCDKGLVCLSNVCVNAGSVQSAASHASPVAPLFVLAGAAFAIFAQL